MFRWLRRVIGGNGSNRPDDAARHQVRARYENATTTPENARQWAAVDYLSAKSANSFQVRRVLRVRSRHELSNNPFLFGVVNNNADDLVGTGPTLQITTGDSAYNRAAERSWAAWWAEVAGVEKLRTAKVAKTADGEGFLVCKTVTDLEHPVKLYPVDVEADQVTTPAPRNLQELWVDGLELHPVTGRPMYYHVLRHHPGDLYFPDLNPLKTDRLQARHVVHWFNRFRPGQVRGVPAYTSSLDLFAELRAFRRAVLKSAEIAADFAVSLESEFPPSGEDNDTEYEPFKRVPIERGLMTVLPHGMRGAKLGNDQPATTYEMFQTLCLGEACRPLSYPLNLALGTSMRFNFSSARLDHLNYRATLDVERAACARDVLDRLLAAWWEEAVLAGAVRPHDGLAVPPHEWHWPGHTSIDPVADAQADHERLSNGTSTWQQFWAARGFDWRDVMAQQAAERDEVLRLGLEFGQPVTRGVAKVEDPADAV